jgi:hypothetical protein
MTLQTAQPASKRSLDWSWMAILVALTVFWIVGIVVVAERLIG